MVFGDVCAAKQKSHASVSFSKSRDINAGSTALIVSFEEVPSLFSSFLSHLFLLIPSSKPNLWEFKSWYNEFYCPCLMQRSHQDTKTQAGDIVYYETIEQVNKSHSFAHNPQKSKH